jgi:hypothetical protein
VRKTARGQQVVERPGKPALGDDMGEEGDDMGEEYALTPGGYRPKALVHRVPPGTVVDGAAGRLRLIDRSGNVVGDFGTLPKHKPGEPLTPANVSHAPPARPEAEPGPPPLGSGWITYTSWTNFDPATPILYFSTTWLVPPAPSRDDGQTIYIYNGLTNGSWILQPVLQWGISQAGGGNYWSIANWYVWGQSGPAFYTDAVEVSPGDQLTGYMWMARQGGDLILGGEAQNVDGIGTSAGPALAGYGPLYMAWKGFGDDPRIWWSAFDGNTWTAQQTVPKVDTSDGPALAVFTDKLYLAWRSPEGDENIWWSAFDGSSWTAPQNVPHVGTSAGPALAAFNDKLYMAWKGFGDDPRIWWSAFDGSTWTAQANLPGASTSDGPALAPGPDDLLYMAWRAPTGDENIWWSAFDGSTWTGKQNVPGVGTSASPALAGYESLYMAWKGFGNDQRIWLSTYDGSTWSPQENAEVTPGTSAGPALAPYGPLYMAWRAPTGDENIWWDTIIPGAPGPATDYTCEFGDTVLSVTNQSPLITAVETLEAYGIKSCSDYPDAELVKMSSISLSVRGPNQSPEPAPLAWSAYDPVTDCGQHVIVVNDSPTDGEVDLYFYS